MGIQKASARRVRQELINQKFVFVYFPSSNCIFMQLQGNDILVNCQGNKFKEHIFIHKKYVHSRQTYLFTELYSFQRTYQLIQ